MGVPNEGELIHMDGEHPSLGEWASRFSITSHEIYMKEIQKCLDEITSSNAEFKVTFCLLLLGTFLAPGTSNLRIKILEECVCIYIYIYINKSRFKVMHFQCGI
ncbi:hypothetical protein ACOSP7_018961 [Xanthoceras sorbifolium]